MAQKQSPLANIDPNSKLNPFNPLSNVDSKPTPTFAQESQQHKSLHSKLMKQERSGKQTGFYVSPSDDIMSPASAKLNALKERRFIKSAKPRTLFSKSSTMSTIEDSTRNQDSSSPSESQGGDVKKEEDALQREG